MVLTETSNSFSSLPTLANKTACKDTAADLIHVLVTIAHGARQEFSLSKVPPRGRWGSPTVKVFNDSLMAAFKAAIALRHHKGEGSN